MTKRLPAAQTNGMDIEQLAQQLVAGTLQSPHDYLGRHLDNGAWVVRAWFPGADYVTAVQGLDEVPMAMLHSAGVFAATLPNSAPYLYRVMHDGRVTYAGEPYTMVPTVSEQDLRFFAEGMHRSLYRALGAHPRRLLGVDGTAFAFWEPAARGVAITGDFNGWSRRSLPMRRLPRSGTWELFVPGAKIGDRYQFVVQGSDGAECESADPMAFQAEAGPGGASIVCGLGGYGWNDHDWRDRRATWDRYHAPMSIYAVRLGSWRKNADGSGLAYADLGHQMAEYCGEMGYTHLELTRGRGRSGADATSEHAAGFYAPNPRFGTPDDFRAFVDTMHRAGIGVILDWTPA